MRILFLSHYFPPEGNAPATRVFEMARRWVAAGHDVTVITGAPNVPNGVLYEGYRNLPWQREVLSGIQVTRVWTYLAPNKGTARRIANYLSFSLTATVAALFVRGPDVVIASSPQFFCGWAGVLTSRLRRVPLVLEIRDLWPESIVAVGAMRESALIRFLGWLERKMYAAAKQIVTVGDGYRSEIEKRGVERSRLTVIPNGIDLEAYRPRPDDRRFRAQYALGDRFVCAYVGTIGMGCGLEIVLRAARRLRSEGRDDLRFVLVGDGAVREELEVEARSEGLEAVVFTGRLPKERMPEVLAAADACLVHLARRPLFKTVLPSKIFEAAAMGKPIILGVEGFAADLVAEAGAGLCFEPENEKDLLEAATRLARNASLCRSLGAAGRERIARRFEWDSLARAYLRTLYAVTSGTSLEDE